MMARIGVGAIEMSTSIPDILVKPVRVQELFYAKKDDKESSFKKEWFEYNLECQHGNCDWIERVEDDADLEDFMHSHITWHLDGMQE